MKTGDMAGTVAAPVPSSGSKKYGPDDSHFVDNAPPRLAGSAAAVALAMIAASAL